jgi:hypothetical protein
MPRFAGAGTSGKFAPRLIRSVSVYVHFPNVILRSTDIMSLKTALLAGFALLAAPASAEYAKISGKDEFMQIVQGKTLTRPLVKLQVSPQGQISGTGVRWEVTGNWSWQDGYFCRDLFWGGSELGYNCQEVGVSEGRIRFTSDRGAGDSAEFRLQ